MKELSNQGGWNGCYPLCHQLQFSTTEVIEKREPELLCNQKPTVEQEDTNGGLFGTLDYPYPGNRIFEPRFAKQIHDRNDIDIIVPEYIRLKKPTKKNKKKKAKKKKKKKKKADR